MKQKNVGGNIVSQISGSFKKFDFSIGSHYHYFIQSIDYSEEIIISHLSSFTVFLLEKPNTSSIKVETISNDMQVGDCVQFEGHSCRLTVLGGGVKIIVAGTKIPADVPAGIKYIASEDIYRVRKPWGHELWMNGQHQNYALKQIFIKSGTKTSLQYHHFKRETNVLMEGKCRLHYKKNSDILNDEVKESNIEVLNLDAISSIDVSPLTIHRIEAVTDVVLYEVSTPHLDDVVRVLDDTNRTNGRLLEEHE